jgi:UMF1 family MFS transporter
MYDFANSAFATTVLSVVFNVYFVQRVVPPGGVRLFSAHVDGAALWGFLVSASMLTVFLVAPVLGALADRSGRKKAFLTAFWLLGCASSAALFFVRPGDVAAGAALFLLGNVGFAAGNIFYNAFLPSLADERSLGRVSGFGWAVGYLGGGLCLALDLFMIRSPETFGLTNVDFLPVRASLLSVGVWWFVFGLPLQFWLSEGASPRFHSTARESGGDPHPAGMFFLLRSAADELRAAFGRLAETARNLGRYRNLAWFLAAYLLYNDGIETIIVMASVFGAQALGMPQDDLVLCFLMIQGVAFVGALGFGWLADRLRHKTAIYMSLAVYAGVTLWAYHMTSAREFWALGVVVGLVLGGSQAASRSLMALLTPAEKSAEFFSFYGLTGKLTSAFGPLVFGVVSQTAGLRAGVLSLLVFFLAGGLLLIPVREPLPDASASERKSGETAV